MSSCCKKTKLIKSPQIFEHSCISSHSIKSSCLSLQTCSTFKGRNTLSTASRTGLSAVTPLLAAVLGEAANPSQGAWWDGSLKPHMHLLYRPSWDAKTPVATLTRCVTALPLNYWIKYLHLILTPTSWDPVFYLKSYCRVSMIGVILPLSTSALLRQTHPGAITRTARRAARSQAEVRHQNIP